MRRGNLFWGIILIVLGLLFLLQEIGLIKDVLGWFWPLGLMLLGAWVLWGRFLPHISGSNETFSIDLQGATRLDLAIDHGAGSLLINGSAPVGVAVCGSQAAGLEMDSHRDGDSLGVDLKAGPTFMPFLGPDGGRWEFKLTQEVPVAIKLEAGASNLDLDLTDVRLTFLGIETGVSQVKAKLPARAGRTVLDIEAGAASIELLIPEGVGARIHLDQGVSSVNIDETRFPKVAYSQKLFESPDFENAVNKLEINLEGGASSISVH